MSEEKVRVKQKVIKIFRISFKNKYNFKLIRYRDEQLFSHKIFKKKATDRISNKVEEYLKTAEDSENEHIKHVQDGLCNPECLEKYLTEADNKHKMFTQDIHEVNT